MKTYGKTILGVVVSLLLLWWALRDVSLAEVVRELRQADLVLLAVAIGIMILGMAVRAVRWGVLLSPTAPRLPFRPRFAATIIGFAANNVLPARVGEFARAFSLGRLTPVSTSAAFAALVVERLLDGLALVGLLFASMATPAFPVAGEVGGVNPRAAAGVVALVMGAVGAILFLMVAAPQRSVRLIDAIAQRLLPRGMHKPLVSALRSFLEGLAVLRNGRLFLASLALALGQWAFLATSFLLAFRAFGIDEVPFAGAVFLQSLLSLAVAIPSSPGFFGPFEAAAKLGLGLWGVPAEKAVSFAVGFHLGGFIPVTLMGAYYVWRLGLSWSDVQHSEDVVEDRAVHGGGPVGDHA
jgi:uncharacterized protein (TIRG00374 family)